MSQVETKLSVASYWLIAPRFDGPHEVRLDQCLQRDGSVLWAIREGGLCLARDGNWEYEPIPSDRDEAFFARCRFSTIAEAVSCWERM